MLLKNAKIVMQGNETKIQDILIQGSYIHRIADYIEASGEVIDLQGKLVLPGGVDVHVHLREPGYTNKETIATGSDAALHGGYTTILAMPNVIPYPDSVEVMKAYQKLIEKDAKVHVYPYACITKQEGGIEVVDMHALKELGIRWFSDDGVGVQGRDIMEQAMESAKKEDVMIVAHTEDMSYRKKDACMHEGVRNKQLNLVGIPSECEYKQVERDLKLALKTKAKYHICHMSCKESVELLRKYKALGADVSGEVSTHHLLLNEMDVDGVNYKMNPPLRSESDQQALLQGLLDGTIDFIANDHAPHNESEKQVGMEKAPFGIVALETSIPLLYTYFVKTGIFTLEQFQSYISSKPAKRFGFDTIGYIKEGYKADMIVIEEVADVIDVHTFVSKGKNTPFDGYKIKGAIGMSMIDGKVVYEGGAK